MGEVLVAGPLRGIGMESRRGSVFPVSRAGNPRGSGCVAFPPEPLPGRLVLSGMQSASGPFLLGKERDGPAFPRSRLGMDAFFPAKWN